MFPERYSVIVVGPPEAGVLDFCAYLASFYQRNGQDVVFVETDTSAEVVQRMIARYHPEKADGASIALIDFVGEPDEVEDGVRHRDPMDLPGLLREIKSLTGELREPVRVIFDSLSSLYIYNAADDVPAFLENLIMLCKQKGSLTATLHEGMHSVEQVIALTSQCDGVIEMMMDENKERFIRIKRMKDMPVRPNWVPFEPILEEGASGASLVWKKGNGKDECSRR